MRVFKLGLVVNPYAGIGGAVALKGSDGDAIRQRALALGAKKQSHQRAAIALKELTRTNRSFEIYTASGEMGELSVREAGLSPSKIVYQTPEITEAEDTLEVVRRLQEEKVDLILFAGGDGTARDIFSVAAEGQMVLGIPAGVKIHSGVYAVTPKAAGLVVLEMIEGQLLSVIDAEVMDIDEDAFRQGRVSARRFGELTIPAELQYVQATKSGGRELEELVLEDIAADIIEKMEDEYWAVGSGTTCAAIMQQLGLENTLLGVDLVKGGQLIQSDVKEADLLRLLDKGETLKIVVTVIGGQGHIFGRGNQQLSAQVLKRIKRSDIHVIATKSKLKALNGRPLLADTGDPSLDSLLSGHIRVITGYHDQVSYPLGN